MNINNMCNTVTLQYNQFDVEDDISTGVDGDAVLADSADVGVKTGVGADVGIEDDGEDDDDRSVLSPWAVWSFSSLSVTNLLRLA